MPVDKFKHMLAGVPSSSAGVLLPAGTKTVNSITARPTPMCTWQDAQRAVETVGAHAASGSDALQPRGRHRLRLAVRQRGARAARLHRQVQRRQAPACRVQEYQCCIWGSDDVAGCLTLVRHWRFTCTLHKWQDYCAIVSRRWKGCPDGSVCSRKHNRREVLASRPSISGPCNDSHHHRLGLMRRHLRPPVKKRLRPGSSSARGCYPGTTP